MCAARIPFAIAVVGAACLVVAPAASAHAQFTPAALNANVETVIQVEVPNERRGHATTGLTLRFPPGIDVIAATGPSGWTAAVDGGTALWSGGRVEGEKVVTFSVTLRTGLRADTYEIEARQLYEDREHVDFAPKLTVLPATGYAAPRQHLGRAVIAGVVGLIVVAASLLGVRYLRRRSLPTG